jgi:AraC-like DNA-binding protein
MEEPEPVNFPHKAMVSHSLAIKSADLAWLGNVKDVSQPLSRLRPIWVKENVVEGGSLALPLPRPTVPHPERHPYCEFTIGCKGGRGVSYIGREKQLTGDRPCVMLLGPGVPHTSELLEYPCRSLVIYFLPVLAFDMGPRGDGLRVLNRFTAEQTIDNRIVYPPEALWHQLRHNAEKMLPEFETGGFGSEMLLRSLLTDSLVALLRWEDENGRRITPSSDPLNWDYVQRALNHLQAHYAEPIYVKEVARAAGLSESRLKAVFRESLGMSCVQYLKSYRVSLAASMLGRSRHQVTEVALAAGFETLSHFNSTFREITGMSPSEYIESIKAQA